MLDRCVSFCLESFRIGKEFQEGPFTMRARKWKNRITPFWLTLLAVSLAALFSGHAWAAATVQTSRTGPFNSGWVGNGVNPYTTTAFSFTPGANGMLIVTVSGE